MYNNYNIIKNKKTMENYQDTQTLLKACDHENDKFRQRVGKDRAASSYLKLLQSRQYLKHYLNEACHLTDIPLTQLTPQFITDFSTWLSIHRHLRSGTIWLTCQHLKAVVARAHQRGCLPTNPFAQFHIAKNIRPREYLTEHELKTLMQHHFQKPQLAYARDLFLFAALTGLSFVDLQNLRAANLTHLNGDSWIIARRHKTKVPYQVKLLPVPMQILSRHAGKDGNLLLKVPKYRTLAEQIRQVMYECGINKRITLHCARHTFAVLTLNHGVPIESVSRMLGHTNITTTQIYARITMRKLDHDMTHFCQQLEKHLF